jgi:hypothetical protein
MAGRAVKRRERVELGLVRAAILLLLARFDSVGSADGIARLIVVDRRNRCWVALARVVNEGLVAITGEGGYRLTQAGVEAAITERALVQRRIRRAYAQQERLSRDANMLKAASGLYEPAS